MSDASLPAPTPEHDVPSEVKDDASPSVEVVTTTEAVPLSAHTTDSPPANNIGGGAATTAEEPDSVATSPTPMDAHVPAEESRPGATGPIEAVHSTAPAVTATSQQETAAELLPPTANANPPTTEGPETPKETVQEQPSLESTEEQKHPAPSETPSQMSAPEPTPTESVIAAPKVQESSPTPTAAARTEAAASNLEAPVRAPAEGDIREMLAPPGADETSPTPPSDKPSKEVPAAKTGRTELETTKEEPTPVAIREAPAKDNEPLTKKVPPHQQQQKEGTLPSPSSSPIKRTSPARSPAPRPKASTPAPTSNYSKVGMPEQLSGSSVHRRPRSALPPLVHTRKLQPHEQEDSIKKLYDESVHRKRKNLQALEQRHNASLIKPVKPLDGDEEQHCVDRLYKQSVEHKTKTLNKNVEAERKKWDAYRKKFHSKDEEVSAVSRLYSSIEKGYAVQQSLFDKYNPKPKRLVKTLDELHENDERFYKGNFGRKGT